MNRRAFILGAAASAGSLVLPYEPRRVYSFARELRVPGVQVPEFPVTVHQAGTIASVIIRGRVFTISEPQHMTSTMYRARVRS